MNLKIRRGAQLDSQSGRLSPEERLTSSHWIRGWTDSWAILDPLFLKGMELWFLKRQPVAYILCRIQSRLLYLTKCLTEPVGTIFLHLLYLSHAVQKLGSSPDTWANRNRNKLLRQDESKRHGTRYIMGVTWVIMRYKYQACLTVLCSIVGAFISAGPLIDWANSAMRWTDRHTDRQIDINLTSRPT